MSKKIDASKIADLAGVSRVTVSRVINNYKFIKPETRERVLKVIAENNYAPNLSAQILAGKSPNTIGLFVYSMAGQCFFNSLEDTNLNKLVHYTAKKASESGFFVMLHMITDTEDTVESARVRDMFLQSRINAGIFIGFHSKYLLIDELVERGFAVGILGHQIVKSKRANCIMVNLDHSAIISAVDYAVRLGHRNICMISSRIMAHEGQDIFAYFKQAMHHRGVAIKKGFVIKTDSFTKDSAAKALSELIKSNNPMPSLIICGSDFMAFGVVETLKKWGYRVPNDISVIGYYDNIISRYFDPPLTTMRFDFDEIISMLFSKVVEHLESPLQQPFSHSYSPELVIRKSCLPSRGENTLI